MKTIISMQFGSHLYGTATPSSDIDIKEVHIPDGRDILLGRVKPVIVYSRKPSVGGVMLKNEPGDTDFESYSLAKFLQLLQEGQTVAIDMLFATPVLTHVSREWWELWSNRDKLMSRQCEPFLGYCRKQAAKYGIKGSRVAAAREFTNFLAELMEYIKPNTKLGELSHHIEPLATATEHAEIIDIELPTQGKTVRHLSVCQRKAPYTISLKEAHAIYSRLYHEYGVRARRAEENDGVDWKAMSHAIRVGTQSIEYLTKHFVTFPRPDAAHLLEIKRGELPYDKVAEELEKLLMEVEEAAKTSTLPEKPDYKWCDEFLLNAHREAVNEWRIQ